MDGVVAVVCDVAAGGEKLGGRTPARVVVVGGGAVVGGARAVVSGGRLAARGGRCDTLTGCALSVRLPAGAVSGAV